MIGVLVTFTQSERFDPSVVTKIADEARRLFEGMPGLRYKFFTLGEDKAHVKNFYVWDSEESASAFFSEQLVERVTELYGVRPSVEFFDIVGFVDNSRS